AAKNQSEQHGDERRIERRQDYRVGQGEGGKKTAAAEHEPGLVSVPDRRDRRHGGIAVLLALEQGKNNADAKIEAIENHIGQPGEGDQTGPQERQVEGHGWHRALTARDEPAARSPTMEPE